jgi:hypothetical protein
MTNPHRLAKVTLEHEPISILPGGAVACAVAAACGPEVTVEGGSPLRTIVTGSERFYEDDGEMASALVLLA